MEKAAEHTDAIINLHAEGEPLVAFAPLRVVRHARLRKRLHGVAAAARCRSRAFGSEPSRRKATVSGSA
jgi:hypothetical protein